MSSSTNTAAPQIAGQPAWFNRFLPDGEEPAGDAGGSFINQAAIRGLLVRQWLLLVAVIGLALLAGLVSTLMTKPLFEASATVRVNREGSNILRGQDVAPTIGINELSGYMETLGKVIESRSMAFRVVDSLKLAERADFLGPEVDQQRPAGASAEQWKQQKRAMAAGKLMGDVSADIPLSSQIITIRYRSGNAAMAAEIANAYADNFVLDDVRNSVSANSYALNYLGERIAEIRSELQEAEIDANSFAKANGIVSEVSAPGAADDGESSSVSTITGAKLASMNTSYAAARAKRLAAEQRWNAVSRVPALQLPEAQQHPVIQALLTDRAKLAGELADLRQRYDDRYPQIVELNAQIGALDRQIGQISSDLKFAIRHEFSVAALQEQALAAEVSRDAGSVLEEQDRRVHHGMLQRNAEALRTQLTTLLDRYNEISSAANVKAGLISKLDAPVIPSGPVSPNLVKNLLVSLIAGLGLALGLAVMRESFDDRLRSLEDVERKLGVPLLGQTPYVSDDAFEEELSNPFSALMESYSSIRTMVDLTIARDHQVLQITSSQASEGKSTTALVLAQKFAELGRKTLLVDADLRRPSVAGLFGLKRPEIGFAEVLLGHTDLKSALLADTGENLDVLPVGAVPPNPVELLSSQKMADFIKHCRGEYAMIFLDTSPVVGIADAPLISHHVDSTIFVVEANRVHFGQAKAALRRLRAVGARVAGAVLTKYRALEAGQTYDYKYDYYSYGSNKKD